MTITAFSGRRMPGLALALSLLGLPLLAQSQTFPSKPIRLVVVIDPPTETVGVFQATQLPFRSHFGDEFTLPDVLPGFAVPVRRFFE